MKRWKTILLLFLTAVVFRVLHFLLFSNQLVIGNDQTSNILLARKFASGDFYGVLDTYWTPLYPILIGIVTFFINSLVLPSLIISIIAGSLAVALTYFLIEQSYGKKEALIAAVIAVFYPHLINSSVFEVGTENIYLVLILGMLISGWKGFQKNSVVYFGLTGFLLALAYLTRPEAFGYIAFFSILAVVKDLWRQKIPGLNSFKQLAVLLLTFTIFAAPYLLYLRGETGRWTISGKAAVNMSAGSFHEDDMTEQPVPTSAKESGMVVFKEFTITIIEIHKKLPVLLPYFLMIFVALGLFCAAWDKERLKRESYLILFCYLTVFGYAITVAQTRYFFILLPIFFGWMAHGIIKFEDWFSDSLKNWSPDGFFRFYGSKVFFVICLFSIYLYVLPLNYYILSRDDAFEERDAGLWLKQHSNPSPLIYSPNLRPAFYAEGIHLNPKTKTFPEILQEIKDRRADYVIISERSLERHPYLVGFAETLQNSSEFELIYQTKNAPGKNVFIFRPKRFCDS